MDGPQFVNYSPIEGHFSCLQFEVITNKAARKKSQAGFYVDVCFHFSGRNVSECNSLGSLVSACQTTFLSGYTFCILPTVDEKSSFSAFSPAFDIVNIFNFSCSNRDI